MGEADAIVLLSGGIDSAVCLTLAQRSGRRPLALSFDYGQRNRVELQAAAAVAAAADVEHVVAPLDMTWNRSDLLGDGAPLRPGATNHVPARNLVFLAVATALAEARRCELVYLGVGASDHVHADCRPAFLEAFERAGRLAMQDGLDLRLRTPLLGLGKGGVVVAGLEFGTPLELTWSCHDVGPQPCGECAACRLRAETFGDIGVDDPAELARG